MLSKETISIIKSTSVVLEERGLEITREFYKNLFENHPELKNIFNMANQRDTNQAQALAGAVLAYSKNIDNLGVLLPTVERIANKHVSIGVTKEQYPIVGGNLLLAIKNVLNLPEGHPILSAWAEAYGVLANIFIEAEAAMYSKKEVTPENWSGFKKFSIVNTFDETPDVKSFFLKSSDNQKLPQFSAGQFVSVKLPGTKEEHDEIRQYSLSSCENENHLKISVKAESNGSVSNKLHAFPVGKEIMLSSPCGVFTLNPGEEDLVFIAGGVGITPLFCMVEESLSRLSSNTKIQFIQCYTDRKHRIFGDKLDALSQRNNFTLKTISETDESADAVGMISGGMLSDWLTDTSAHIYLCGPKLFMLKVSDIAKKIGFSDNQIHFEVFGPS